MAKKQDVLRKSLDHYLKDFQSEEESLKEGHYGLEHGIDLEENLAPLPYMVFICLVVLKGFKSWGRGEKVLWEIPIKYKSFSFLLSHRKFGFRLHYKGEEPPKNIVKEMIKQLNKAIKIADKLMQPFAKEQIHSGNVTMANRYIRLDMRYRFFRKKAQEAFSRSKKKPKTEKNKEEPSFTSIVNSINYMTRMEREGAYYTVAMLDAYFSKLEHLLVLVIPFLEFDCTKENLVDLISTNWNAKYKRIFDLKTDHKAKILFDRLTTVREKYRNPVTHGDFEKRGASLYFHLPGLSAVPVCLSSFKDSIYYSFLPVNMDSYKDICALLDEVDAFLRNGKTKYGVMFAETGLDVAFSKESLAEYTVATESDDKFKSFVEGQAYMDMIYMNMDF